MSIIFAIIIAAGTLVICVLIVMADMMSDNPSAGISPVPTFIGGMIIAGLVLASHWIPWGSIGW